MSPEKPGPLGRRHLILGGAATGLGALAAAGAALASGTLTGGPQTQAPTDQSPGGPDVNGAGVVPFYGARQAGISTAAQAHGSFVALNLKPGTTPARLRSLLRLLSDDAAALTQGTAALADTEPELAQRPAHLTVTLGFGPAVFEILRRKLPAAVAPLPKFGIDALDPQFSGGDLLLQICADDPLAVAHAQRMLLKDSRAFASVHWIQSGFRRAYGTEKPGVTMRNLFGQVDGTVNAEAGSDEHERVVWGGDGGFSAWVPQGTTLVIRRIAMNLDKWDELDREGREESVGRRLGNGAPLTGSEEHDEPDFTALNPVGFPVIADFAHMRRARPDDPRQRIFRRAYNYDAAPGPGSQISDSGLIFASYQADAAQQFTPIQRRLDELDLLNQWTTPVGSAVFAIPPGCSEGGFVGEALFD